MKDDAYQKTLGEFRIDIFQRLSIVVTIFSLTVGFVLIFVNPIPHQFVLTLQFFGGFVIFLRHLASSRPNLALNLFVSGLYVVLAIGLLTLPAAWLPFIVAPLILIAELLTPRLSIVLGILFLGFAAVLTQTGYADYPLLVLALYTGFVFAVTRGCLHTIWLLLDWYRDMFSTSNTLLAETRAQRAELVQALKSLEIARDTQQRLQAQLIFARQQAEEARRLKERFASNISHELRTPLNVILGFTEIMHVTPEVYGAVHFPPKLQQDIYQIHRNSRHLLEMIDDVLDLSHIELSQFSLNFELTDLKRFLQDTVSMLSNLFRDKPVAFNIEIADALPEIQIDRTRIRQVIINLINNAQRFTLRGSVTFCVYASNSDVIFKVADTGIGIPQDQIHLIFEEFFQVDYSLSRANGGAGLGLAITRRFIEAHNGHLQVESKEGVGSTFTFTLPLPRPSLNHNSHVQKSNDISREVMWLVVDADPHVSKLIRRHIHDGSVVGVDSPEQLDEAIHRYSPQGIIFNNPQDGTLPDNLANASVPVVTCSLPSTTQFVKKLGVNSCLAKPMLPEQLIEQLQPYNGIRNLLVVDDDIGVVQLVQRTLENYTPHLVVRRAYDGQQACEMMKTAIPDLVLLDLAMPVMSGFEVIAAMKDDVQLRDIPIILLTATKYIYSDNETRGDMHIHQNGGLTPMEVLRLLNMITHTVKG